MKLRLERLFLSTIWFLILATSIAALRIPALPAPGFDNSALRRIRQFAVAPLATLPKTELEPLDFKEYGAKRVIMRYGPYAVPPMSENNGMKEFNELEAERPCVDCFVTKLQAGLEYPNGTIANSDTGMWLHHAVLYDFGRQDLSCPSLPYRFFASGNERTRLDLTLNGSSKTGFPLLGDSKMGVTVEFMNEYHMPRDTVLTIEFEYIPTLHKDFKPVDGLWLDITGVCGESEAEIPPDKDVFEYRTPDVKVNSSGLIIAAGGHLHDGGTLVRITLNGKDLCDFMPEYGGSPGFVDTNPMIMPMAKGTNKTNNGAALHLNKPGPRLHISNMPLCYRAGHFMAGDAFGIIAFYNISLHEPMAGGKGGFEPIMGISIIYLENDLAMNPSKPGIGVTTAPFAGITVTQTIPPPVPNSGIPSNSQNPSSPITNPPGSNSLTFTELPGPITSIIPILTTTSLSVIPIVLTTAITREGLTTTVTITTSIIITYVPAPATSPGRSNTPITIITPTPTKTSNPITPAPSITKPPTKTKTTTAPWWINVSRSRAGLVPMFTSRSGSWQFTYRPGSRTTITKYTTPVILIPIPIIIPLNGTVWNPGWTITIPLPPRKTTITEIVSPRKRVAAPTPTATGRACPNGYPCGALYTEL